MTAEMTKRERVERTMECKETDRVPVYDLLRNDDAFAYFSGEKLPQLNDDADTIKELDRIAGKAVEQFLDMTRSVGFGPVKEIETTDDFGFVHHHSPFEKTSWIVKRPFEDEKGAIDFVKKWIPQIQKKTEEINANPLSYRDPMYSEDGVDVSLIRWMLSMTPAQRLHILQQNIRSIKRLREGRPNS